MMRISMVAGSVPLFLSLIVAPAFADEGQATPAPIPGARRQVASLEPSASGTFEVTVPAPTEPEAPEAAPAAPNREWHTPFGVPSHHFTWAPTDTKNVQVGVNFGLLQLGLGGFNVAGEVRYRRMWFEYSHGVDLKLNDLGGYSMTGAERAENLHIVVPYTTGFGAGFTILDELWLGVEFKTHRYEVNAPGGPVTSYQTYSIGPVLGYKLYVWRGFFLNAYGRYWPNVATSLPNNQVALQGTGGTVEHSAHDFGLFANLAVGGTFDL
jgi:hypothetical protein